MLDILIHSFSRFCLALLTEIDIENKRHFFEENFPYLLTRNLFDRRVFVNLYSMFSEKNLRGKWRNIRDYFMKELKLQKTPGPAGRKRKKYMYFDRLLFLMPTVENKRYR